MRQSGRAVLSHLEQSLDQAIQAKNRAELLESVGELVQSLIEALGGPNSDLAHAEVAQSLAACSTDIRRRRLLEFCLSPIFDKAPLPAAETADNEFLWIFAIPFVVTFSPEALRNPVVFSNQVVDAGAILGELQETGYMNSEGSLRSSVRLFKREDLQVLGPPKLAKLFVHAEVNQADVMEPLPLMLDPEMDAYRSVTLFMLAASRMPMGESRLYDRAVDWPAQTMARVVEASLQAQNIAVESVKSLPPHSIPEMLMRFSGPAAHELRANLENAKQEYPGVGVVVRTAIDGYAEVNGILPDGTEVVLIPAFSYFESNRELTLFIEQTCKELEMPFTGLYGFNVQQPATLH
ncbi:hypothetical protein [Burkholderia cenocepacia]|uniref:hypothetical protein n=1 Tax=Burkholderia cenocepacia TaxID=95486 RepID=UPI0007616B86|nr:hypothetical protein [Burkholderia cenocepacia]KWU24774.1 hypothetical protein AS149_32020 [Burkholderia cenocepacia]